MSSIAFIGSINDDSWLGHVGTFLSVSFGPRSRATIRQRYAELQAQPGVDSFSLRPADLPDFTVCQVHIAGGSEAGDLLREQVQGSDDPLLNTEELLGGQGLFLLTEDHDEITVGQLALYTQGTLEMSVYLPDMFDGRSFLMDGAIALERLADDDTTPLPEEPQELTVAF